MSRSGGVVRAVACAVALASALACAGSVHAATITLINRDDPGEGFNDPTPVAPVGGNTGTTIGEQRLIAFQYAVDIWAAQLESPVEIRVGATFDPLQCDAGSVTLGQAGALNTFANFAGAPQHNVLYVSALADRLAGMDLAPGEDDIVAQFNSTFGTTCTFRAGWYYGLDGDAPGIDSDFVTVVLHELGHGFGFLTFVDVVSGARANNFNDPFMSFMVDDRSGKSFADMTNAERRSATRSNGHLKWEGAEVVAASGVLTAGADDQGRVQLYAPPDPVEGSSLSHWSDVLAPDELMEPYFTHSIHTIGLAAQALEDIGWTPLPTGCSGDCDGDGQVTITDLMKAINIALGEADLSSCTALDSNGDGALAVNELVAAVSQALNGCAA